jgi:tyrosinase
MKSFLLSILWILFHVHNVCAQTCTNPAQRKEIRQLTTTERDNYIRALNLANAGPRPTPYDRFVQRHWQTAGQTHGTALFFPFHRTFTWSLEQLLRTFVPGVLVPYWDFTLDAADPASSPILQNNFCGGRGTGDTCRLLVGPFANRVCSYSANPAFTVHYLRRCYNSGTRISPFYSYEVITRMLADSQTYNSFRQAIEGAPHGSVHWGVGGNDWGDFVQMTSPCDPLFWPLHAYLDKLWDQWQRSASTHFSNFGGPLSNGATATLDTVIPAYTNYKVSNVLDTRSGPFCYRYSDNTAAHDQTVNLLVNDLQKRALFDIDPARIQSIKLQEKPLPLPESFIARMNWNHTSIRENEQKYSAFIDTCNRKVIALKSAVDESIKASNGQGSIDKVVEKYQGELGDADALKKFVQKIIPKEK